MDEAKEWKCRNGHVLGLVARNGSKRRRLLLYRNAVDMSDDPCEVDVMALVEGYVADVACSICGSVRTWVPGQEDIERLVQQIADRH